MPEAMLFNQRQAVVLDDIKRFWKAEKNGNIPCIFFVDARGDCFHVTYSPSPGGEQVRDDEFSKLLSLI